MCETDLEMTINCLRRHMIEIAAREVGNDRAEEITQAALVAALSESTDPNALYDNWPTKIDSAARGYRRERAKTTSLTGHDTYMLAPPITLGDCSVERMLDLSAHLTTQQHEILLASEDGYSVAEIAAKRGCTQDNVYKHLQNAKAKLANIPISDLGFSSPEALFNYCSTVTIYRKPSHKP